MKIKIRYIMAMLTSLCFAVTAVPAEKITVVTSFSILGDIVKQVGKEQVDVVSLVGSDENAHTYQPSPNDVKAIRKAKLVVVHGLHFDDWMIKLMKSADYQAARVVVSRGISPIEISRQPAHGHNHGDLDPHAWHDITNVIQYVRNLQAALSKIDPDHQSAYQANANAYIQQLENLNRDINTEINRISKDKRRILTAHNAFAYLGRRYGLTMIALQGVNPHSEASARDMANIIRQAKDANVQVMFLENITDDRVLKQISRESGVKIGGVLYSDALSKANGPAATYLDLMRFNMKQIVDALK